MNIIELAKEAGFFEFNVEGWSKEFEKFAALVRAEEREKVKKVLMTAHELSKQHHNYYHYITLQLDDAMEKIK